MLLLAGHIYFFVQEKLITSSACYFTLLQATLQIDKYVIEIRFARLHDEIKKHDPYVDSMKCVE